MQGDEIALGKELFKRDRLDVDAFRTAFGRPEFRSRLAQYPDSAVASPNLFE